MAKGQTPTKPEETSQSSSSSNKKETSTVLGDDSEHNKERPVSEGKNSDVNSSEQQSVPKLAQENGPPSKSQDQPSTGDSARANGLVTATSAGVVLTDENPNDSKQVVINEADKQLNKPDGKVVESPKQTEKVQNNPTPNEKEGNARKNSNEGSFDEEKGTPGDDSMPIKKSNSPGKPDQNLNQSNNLNGDSQPNTKHSETPLKSKNPSPDAETEGKNQHADKPTTVTPNLDGPASRQSDVGKPSNSKPEDNSQTPSNAAKPVEKSAASSGKDDKNKFSKSNQPEPDKTKSNTNENTSAKSPTQPSPYSSRSESKGDSQASPRSENNPKNAKSSSKGQQPANFGEKKKDFPGSGGAKNDDKKETSPKENSRQKRPAEQEKNQNSNVKTNPKTRGEGSKGNPNLLSVDHARTGRQSRGKARDSESSNSTENDNKR